MIGIFLDCETNGLNSHKHRVLEMAFRLIHLETGEEIASFTSLVYQDQVVWENSDPQSLEVNGFRREMVDQGRREGDVAADIKTIFEKCDVRRGQAVFICQNPSFDRVFFSQLISPDEQEELNWPYHWLDLASMHWGRTIADGEMLPWVTGFSKDQIAQTYGLPAEAAPHRAMGGVDHLILCYDQVIGFPANAEVLESPTPRN